MKIIRNQLDTKNNIIQEGHNVVRTKIKSRKAAVLDEIPPEIWKTRKCDHLQLQ